MLPAMHATITYTDKGLTVEIGGVKFAAVEKASFETDIALADLPRLVQLDPSALGILKVMSSSEPASRADTNGRRRGRPPKGAAPRKAARRSGAGTRTGNSIWSGASSFNPRWSNLKPDEVVGLGLDRIPSPLWGKIRDSIKALDKDTWKDLRGKWEGRIKEATKKDDKALESEWRTFLEASKKSAK
jgi:hypothetical protein